MRMNVASKSKIKGNYHENYFVKLFSKLGFDVRKQPLSGVLQEYPADIVVTINGKEYLVEVKYRSSGSFPSPFTLLENNRDMLLYKRKKGKPQWFLAISDTVVEDIVGTASTREG